MRLIADVAQRMGFSWKSTIRATASTSRQVTKRALNKDKPARRGGYSGVAGRFSQDKDYSGRMLHNCVDMQMMMEWGELLAKREIAPLPVYTMSYSARAKEYTRCGRSSPTVGGINTTPHLWNYPELDQRSMTRPDHDRDQDPSMTSWGWSRSSSG